MERRSVPVPVQPSLGQTYSTKVFRALVQVAMLCLLYLGQVRQTKLDTLQGGYEE